MTDIKVLQKIKHIKDNNLTTLDLSYNNLTEIPKEINELTQLEALILFNNKITKIKNLNNLTRLKLLDISNNYISKINGLENLILLQQLHISFNRLTEIKGLENLTRLKILDLIANSITELKGLKNLILLQELYLNFNLITEIKGLERNTQLIRLHLGFTKITQIKNLENNTQLIYLYLDANEIIEIKGLNNLNQLIYLHLNCNQISEIKGLENNTQLQELYLNNNKITQIPLMITLLQRLEIFDYINNEIEYTPPQTVRFLNRIKNGNQVYLDTQSVHNHNIQECIRNGIEYISSIKPSLTFEEMSQDILNNMIFDEESKDLLFEYCECKDIHSTLNITFGELLLNVYSIILNNEHKDEMFKIMKDEMKESQCKCFTGRMSRLVNCLNGFDSNISINISDNEQISNIILLVKEKYIDIENIKEEVRKEMEERGYKKDIINEWIDYIE